MQSLRTGRVHAGTALDSGTILLQRLLGLWLHLQAKQRSRRQLGRLDSRLLRDVGIDPASAQAEAKRPLWQ
jgi:uncharacterized protein YjiS (DUF1127 family)